MSPFLKPVKSGSFYVAALEAGRAESSRGSGLLACRRRASYLQQTGIHFCRNMRPQKAWPRNCDSTCDPYARCARSHSRQGGEYESAQCVQHVCTDGLGSRPAAEQRRWSTEVDQGATRGNLDVRLRGSIEVNASACVGWAIRLGTATAQRRAWRSKYRAACRIS